LPFFTPIYIKGNCFDFYSGFRDLEARLCDQHHPWHIPVPWEGLNSTRKIHLLSEARSISIGNTRVKMMELSHPGKSFGFRFEDKNGRVVIYSSDAEFKSKQNNNIEKYIGFFKDADILIFDTQYTPGETLTKEDWGHSSVIVGTEIAIQAGVKNLLMFHYDPAYNDEKIVNLYQRAQQHREILSQHSSDVKIHIGYEGMTIEV
jgi:ribonuclease BN (tRNA processing enzyme)